MSEREKIASVLRQGERWIWLDPQDALEMADDLIRANYVHDDTGRCILPGGHA